MGLSEGALRKPVAVLLDDLIKSHNRLDRGLRNSSRPLSNTGLFVQRGGARGALQGNGPRNAIAARHCNVSVLGRTSFFLSKPFGCYGDGGATFTNDDASAQACHEIRGRGKSQRYFRVGRRMGTLQCAVVLVKMGGFEWRVPRHLRVGAHYNAFFDRLGVRRIQRRSDRTSIFAQCTVLAEDRAALQAKIFRVLTEIHAD